MKSTAATGFLLREVVRLYVRLQRTEASCADGASTVQCHALNELLRHEGLTQRDLVERLGFDKAWISRAVDALVASESVSRQADQIDRRCVRLALTPSGYRRAQALDQTLNEHAGQFIDFTPQEQHDAIHQSLQLLLAALQQDGATKANTPCVQQPCG